MKALNLSEAINILDPEHHLQTPEEIRDYFVERPMSPLEELQNVLLSIKNPQKFLFTGHRGSGKSTELVKLAQNLFDRFYVIHYSIKDILNLTDITYVDIVLSLGLKLIEEITKTEPNQKISIDDNVLEHILNFTKEITKEVEIGGKNSGEISSELNFYVVKLGLKLGTEDATRTIVREKVSHRISDLLESIDILSYEVERILGRKVLIIIEDLDKTDTKTTKELFYDHARSLLSPRVSVIFTFPIELRNDNNFMQIESNFPNIYIFPNLKIRTREGKPDKEGRTKLQEIITRKVDKNLFIGKALDTLVEYSGGIPRELIVLARQACVEALVAEKSKVDKKSAENAMYRKRRDYQVLLSSSQLGLLKKIHKTKQVENDEEHRALLHNLSALEYRNQEVWYDVHPIVKTLLPQED